MPEAALAPRAAFHMGFPARSLTSRNAADLGQHLSLWGVPSVAFSPSTCSITCSKLEKLMGCSCKVVFGNRAGDAFGLASTHLKAKHLLEALSLEGLSAVSFSWVLVLCDILSFMLCLQRY